MTKSPKYSDLPLNKGDPFRSAWGLYGKDDQLGTLNRLTEDIVLEASKEIKTGTRISLNWPMDVQNKTPFFNRQVFHQNMYAKPPRCVNDDVWTFNTQSSSQWDGLRHFAYQKEKRFYGDVTLEDIHTPGSTVNGVGAWSEKGIVGRGILIDYYSWAQNQDPPIPHDAFATSSIPLEHLKAALAAQGTEIRFGDILFTRTGFVSQYTSKSDDELKTLAAVNPPGMAGVEQSEEMLEWIWSNFSAVAGDQPSFECWPTQKEWMMHEVLLAGWGCPIGELFDLEKLSEECKRTGRYSFFVTSEVCNVPSGVASPPNILAIF
ncbi:hypothetical protein BDV96DRAFT_55183 [Lophiotrema nucula]|uniref:Cyclase-domain-containing protein n=1 Tax=Lophiotrema nucula TaxID=690887 RepID=A0A6A5Z9G8_9PLEO|nr:hypothetical protein BDV96DRAFT_55183 [Lophiotrema nucula]